MKTDWTGETQTREKWLEWRGKGIGSSDMPVILGVSPFKKVFKLWMEKTGQEEDTFKGNWATERGNKLEPMVRDWYNKTHSLKMAVENFEHKIHKHFRASLDGVDHTVKKFIEIKCPGREDHDLALVGIIPEKYIPQIHWQMIVTGYDTCDYVSFNDRDYEESKHFAVVKAQADPDYHKILIEEAQKFWAHVTNRTRPPGVGVETIEDPLLVATLAEYQWVVDEISKLERMKDDITARIKSVVKEGKAVCNDYTISWVERKGNVDYKKIPDIANYDLELYRAPSSTFLTIKRAKA